MAEVVAVCMDCGERQPWFKPAIRIFQCAKCGYGGYRVVNRPVAGKGNVPRSPAVYVQQYKVFCFKCNRPQVMSDETVASFQCPCGCKKVSNSVNMMVGDGEPVIDPFEHKDRPKAIRDAVRMLLEAKDEVFPIGMYRRAIQLIHVAIDEGENK